MSRVHGSEAKVFLGGRNASGDISSISPKFSAASHDATTFGSGGWAESDAGLKGWGADIEAFYDPAIGGIGRQFEDLLGMDGVLSVYDGAAAAIGATGILFSSGLLESRDQPISVADLMKLSGAIAGNGRVGMSGKLLHVLAQETITGTGASLNNTASSPGGGRANLHVTAITGTWTIKVEDSADGTTGWAAIATFGGVTAIGGFTAEVVGTVRRYLRVSFVEDVPGSCTFLAGFARY